MPSVVPFARRAAPTIDLNRSAVSRYIQLATLFRRRIEQGSWKPGERIPTVDELAAECGVARATIRQALDQIEADGLIERFRAKGTFVRDAPATNRLWCEVETDWSGLLRSREGAEIEVLGERKAIAGSAVPAATAGSAVRTGCIWALGLGWDRPVPACPTGAALAGRWK